MACLEVGAGVRGGSETRRPPFKLTEASEIRSHEILRLMSCLAFGLNLTNCSAPSIVVQQQRAPLRGLGVTGRQRRVRLLREPSLPRFAKATVMAVKVFVRLSVAGKYSLRFFSKRMRRKPPIKPITRPSVMTARTPRRLPPVTAPTTCEQRPYFGHQHATFLRLTINACHRLCLLSLLAPSAGRDRPNTSPWSGG